MKKGIQYNSPVILSFALLSLAVLILNFITGGRSNALLFSVYRSPLTDLLTYPRFFLHVLGHANFSHYINNILLLLVVGPPLEERFGSRAILLAMAITAFVTGLVHYLLFPGTALLGASGIVFMLIVMISMTGRSNGKIPLTMLIVIVLYLGNELLTGLTSSDNISQLTHILGGVSGLIIGNRYYLGDRPRHHR